MRSLRSTLVVAFVVVAFVPAAALSIWGYGVTRQALTRNANAALLASARQLALRLDAFVEANLDAARTHAQIPQLALALEQGDPARVETARGVLLGLGRADPVNLSWCSLVARDGSPIADTRAIRASSRETPIAPPAFDDLPRLATPGGTPSGRVALLIFVAPVRDERGRTIGELQIAYNVSILQQIVARSTTAGFRRPIATLLDRSGIRLAQSADPDARFTLARAVPESTQARLRAEHPLRESTAVVPLGGLPAGAIPEAGVVFEATEQGERWLAATVPMRAEPWLVIYRIPRSEALAPVADFARRALGLSAIIAALVGFGAVFVARRITDPLGQLTAAVARFGRGERGTRVELRTDDEIGALAATFNHMTATQEALVRRLEERTRELEADIELRRRLEAQLLEARKLEAVGRLAGGIAHDFNNILTVILGNAEMVERALPADSPMHADVSALRAAGLRAAELTRQLLAFARRQPTEARVLNVNDVVRGLDGLLRRLIGADVELVTLLGADLWNVKIDPSQLEQVLMNLAANARDAMPGGGRFAFETANVRLSGADAGGLPPGDYVAIDAHDTGHGMSEEVVARVFEPFFTTKEFGRGTGLGLASAYGVIEQAGGRITVESRPDAGARFRIVLPRTLEPPRQPAPAVERPGPETRGHETVLVAEDEPLVRDLIERTLSERGYRLLVSRDGEEALTLARTHQGPIDALVTDIAMPLVSGPELAARLAEMRPGVRVLFVSGYRDDPRFTSRLGDGAAFLPKPFTAAELVIRLRRLLETER